MALPIADCVETQVFRFLTGLVLADPDVQRLGTTISCWTGDESDNVDPTIEQLPYVQITPYCGDTSPFAYDLTKVPFIVQIMTITRGTDMTDSLNFWSVVRKVFFPGDRSITDKLNAIPGIVPVLYLRKQADKPSMVEGIQAIETLHTLCVNVNVNTMS